MTKVILLCRAYYFCRSKITLSHIEGFLVSGLKLHLSFHARYAYSHMDSASLREKALKALDAVTSQKMVDVWHTEYLGRKGAVNTLLTVLVKKTAEEKRRDGPVVQAVKRDLEEAYTKKLRAITAKSADSGFDPTLPGLRHPRGALHPLTLVERDIKKIFSSMNFGIVDGPELETERYNFDALNIPKSHPARDMQDTLWVSSTKGLLMRTHTSPMQVRHMEKNLPPFQILSVGKVFRNEATDASHEVGFHQFEGLMVGEDVTLANMKWIVLEFFKRFFGRPVEARFRPSYFPFVEPGVEVDIKLNGAWLEVMGAGMVHPAVFEAVQYDPKEVRGFAFGGGLDRFAMIRHGVPDIRLFYDNDLRFIRQFS